MAADQISVSESAVSVMRPYALTSALINDAEAITRLGADTWEASFSWSLPAADSDAYLSKAYSVDAIRREILDQAHNKFYIARQHPWQGKPARVVGFVQLKFGTTEPCIPDDIPVCELNRIYVSRECIGGGIGKGLLEHGVSWACTNLLDGDKLEVEGDGKPRAGVWLGVWEENFKARRFYERYGFEKIGVHDFVMGKTTQQDHVMIKWLY